MVITKTRFLNLTRCPKFVSLDNEFVDSITYEDYKKEEMREQTKELLDNMVQSEATVNKHLEAMNPYYKQVELEAGRLVHEKFGGNTIYALDTKKQVSYSANIDGTMFLCYVDIYNESKEEINIIEVKATTSKKYLDLTGGYRGKDKYTIFSNVDGVYKLKDEVAGYDIEKEMPIEDYERQKNKLLDRYLVGSYIYDLAVQRYIVEHSGVSNKKIHYYLAVLNHKYVYDGYKENGRNVYHRDMNGEDLISLFLMDNISFSLQSSIEKDAKELISRIKNKDVNDSLLGPWCNYNKATVCPYFKSVCASLLPKSNSVLSYMNNAQGFKFGKCRLKGLDLINAGFIDMLDIPIDVITNQNHIIQRESYINKEPYINKEKIRCIINSLEYPIYHLDFETFPCPIPRFKGESPYTQSPFEFSLHIERSPGVCDKIKDNYIFLATTTDDEREELIKYLLSNIDVTKGTLLAQNVNFEKGRILELANMFPKYREKLIMLSKRTFDLLYILNNNKEFYQTHGFTKEDVNTVNFYDYRLSGSYSIKKTLPLFSDLSYDNLEVKNGTEAIISYANYKNMSKEELEETLGYLKVYCRQDTWAMVEILNKIRKLVD